MTSVNSRGKYKITPLNSNATVNILTIFSDLNPEWFPMNRSSMLHPVRAMEKASQTLEEPHSGYVKAREVKSLPLLAPVKRKRG